VKRFEREAMATANLRSTHTIDVYDFGVTEDGAFYYVMEFLEGLNLDAMIRRFGPIGRRGRSTS
jgi:serine/threonine-protein kinase